MRPCRTVLAIAVAVLLAADLASATLSKSDKKGKKKAKEKKETPNPAGGSGPASSSVKDRGLVSERVTAADVLAHAGAHSEDVGRRGFPSGAVLGYVTPWNNRGYDVAKDFGAKFSLVSPVWLQLLPKSEGGGKFKVRPCLNSPNFPRFHTVSGFIRLVGCTTSTRAGWRRSGARGPSWSPGCCSTTGPARTTCRSSR